MDTLENRVRRVQARSRVLRKRRDRTRLAELLILCLVLACALIREVIRQNALHRPIHSAEMTASSLLDSSVGGYVLTAVLAFTAGVILTVFLCRTHEKRSIQSEALEEKQEKGGNPDAQ